MNLTPGKRRTLPYGFQVSEYATLPANLCPFSWRREVTCFDEDFGKAVGEAVEANANSVV
jgi:hypothetical protein